MNSKLYLDVRLCSTPQGVSKIVRALDADATGLVMTPNACKLHAWHKGHPEQDEAWLEDAFEIRVFCPAWELRWHRNRALGVATLMREDSDDASRLDDAPKWFRRHAEIRLEGTRQRKYLLWGKVVEPERDRESEKDWLTLGNQRTGPIRVPFASSDPKPLCGARIQLVAREYLAKFEDGNVCVFDQRLYNLVVADDGQ